MVILGALDRVRSTDDRHTFVIKGGVAMEIRLGMSARATRDVDMTFCGDRESLDTALDIALADSYGGFSFRRSNLMPIGQTGAHRAQIKMDYRGKGWMTLDLEVTVADQSRVEVEMIPAISITDFQLLGPSRVATLSLRYQIAQKIHAVTEEIPGRDNSRVRDILDLVLLADLVSDMGRIKEACLDVFNARAAHEWPPVITVPSSWSKDYAGLVDNLALPAPTFDDAVTFVRDLIDNIADA